MRPLPDTMQDALRVTEATRQWRGTYNALIQPADEIGAGARSMVEAGLRDAVPRTDVALGQHVYTYEAGRVQTSVSRSIAPGTFGVATVGAFNAGSRNNVIGDRAEPLLNVRTFETDLRDPILAEIEHIVRSECASSRSPRDPEFDYYDQPRFAPVPQPTPRTGTEAAVTAAFA